MRFTDLLENFDVVKYLQKSYREDVSELKLEDMLKDAKLIFDYLDNRIAYHGRECSYRCLKLYKYKDLYLVMYFDLEGDEDDMFQEVRHQIVCHHTHDPAEIEIDESHDTHKLCFENFLNDNIDVIDYPIDISRFIKTHRIAEIYSIVQLFKAFYSDYSEDDVKQKLSEYVLSWY